jgi:hypothetical protein
MKDTKRGYEITKRADIKINKKSHMEMQDGSE